MDLTIQLEEVKLNIRVAVLVKTSNGYIFEKSNKGYLFTIGGRVKANETSLEATQREVLEEIGYNLKSDVKLTAIIENFFSTEDSNIHEICFVYSQEEEIEIDLPSNFIQIHESELDNKDIRPEVIKKIILSSRNKISHHLIRQ